jgi:hypothetical protein
MRASDCVNDAEAYAGTRESAAYAVRVERDIFFSQMTVRIKLGAGKRSAEDPVPESHAVYGNGVRQMRIIFILHDKLLFCD